MSPKMIQEIYKEAQNNQLNLREYNKLLGNIDIQLDSAALHSDFMEFDHKPDLGYNVKGEWEE